MRRCFSCIRCRQASTDKRDECECLYLALLKLECDEAPEGHREDDHRDDYRCGPAKKIGFDTYEQQDRQTGLCDPEKLKRTEDGFALKEQQPSGGEVLQDAIERFFRGHRRRSRLPKFRLRMVFRCFWFLVVRCVQASVTGVSASTMVAIAAEMACSDSVLARRVFATIVPGALTRSVVG